MKLPLIKKFELFHLKSKNKEIKQAGTSLLWCASLFRFVNILGERMSGGSIFIWFHFLKAGLPEVSVYIQDAPYPILYKCT